MIMACKTFHKGKYYLNIKRGFEDCKKDITITVEKVFESDCLRIYLSNEEDPTFLCVLNVTRDDYEDLKRQQGLLIDFDNFPSQLVRLLQQCASNNMFLILQQTNPIQFYFEIVEHNEFRRLVHLSLKTSLASDSDIKQHMADSISHLKKTITALKNTSSSSEAIWNDKCINLERKVLDLTHIVSKMEEDKLRRETELHEALTIEKERLAQEKLLWQKNIEMNTKAQISNSQDNLSRKDRQIDELNSTCRQLKDNIQLLEQQISEKTQRLNLLEKEVQKTHIEVATLNAKNATLEREITEKEKQFIQLNSKCTFLEKTVRENADTIRDLNNSLHIFKREKSSLEDRLAISESLAKKSNDAAHSTSEQLLKANQIISKQNADLIEMKEKLLCRTAIALEQEKVIERNTKEMEELKSQISDKKKKMDSLEKEFDSLKEKYDSNEQALKERDETIKNNNMVIQWLHKKMEDHQPSDDIFQSKQKVGASSTPYFSVRHNQSNLTQEVSDESINFYATSKLSVEESPQMQTQVRSQIRLDPKYLKPATVENKQKNTKDATKGKCTEEPSLPGKENKIVELPKVDYREKKSSRTTYRTTPVSAYFPR